MNRNPARVGTTYTPRLRVTSRRHDVYKRFVPEPFFKQHLYVSVARQMRVKRCVYATNRWRQVRHEHQVYWSTRHMCETLDNFGVMAMTCDTISPKTIGHLRKQDPQLGFPASPADA